MLTSAPLFEEVNHQKYQHRSGSDYRDLRAEESTLPCQDGDIDVVVFGDLAEEL